MKINLTGTVLGFALAGFTGVGVATAAERPPGMAWIPGGEFAMGTDEEDDYPAERSGASRAVTASLCHARKSGYIFSSKTLTKGDGI
jgi:hypothetical protein